MSQVSSSVDVSEQGLLIKGDLVFSNVSKILADAEQLLNRQQQEKIVIQCADINRMDTAGLSLLLEWKRWCQQQHKTCQFEALPKQALSLIKTYKLNTVLGLSV